MIKYNSKLQDRFFPIQNVLFFGFLLMAAGFLFWKCRYGFADIDECFILSVPYRLFQGDGLLQEEWNLAQMSGVLTLPFVSAFVSITGSTDGIVLAMRYITTFVQCCVAVFIYCKCKPLSWFGASLAAISYVLYIPFGIMTLSYNSLGVLFVILSSILLLTAEKRIGLSCYLAGLCFAAAVLGCPYLLLIFALYLCVVLLRMGIRKAMHLDPDASVWSFKNTLWVCAGCATAALLFAIFVLSRSSVSGIIRSLGPMLNDPEHQPFSWILKSKGFVVFTLRSNEWTRFLYPGLAAIALAYLADWKRQFRKDIYVCLFSIGMLVLMYSYCRFIGYINQTMWSINVYAPFIFLLTTNVHTRKVFYTVWIPGILYAYSVFMGSNQEFYAISSGSSAASVGSILMIGMYFSELLHAEKKTFLHKPALGLMCLVLCFQIGTQAYYRYRTVYWDDNVEELTYMITDGIEKGIYTSQEKYQEYYEDLACIETLKTYDSDRFLHISRKTWYNLHLDAETAGYSSWLSYSPISTLERLTAYYEINPQKMPDLVFVDPDYKEVIPLFCDYYSYYSEPVEGGTVLLPK